MGSLTVAQANVGSAVDDTTRVTGGALGVAVPGSLLSSGYRGDMEDLVSRLPADAGAMAQDSVPAALAVAARSGADGAPLAEAAREAFVSGMHAAALVAAAVMLAGAALAHRHLAAHASVPTTAASPVELDPVAA